MTAPTLETNPDHESLKVLRDEGVISAGTFWESIRGINESQEWARWAARLCLLIGSALILAALVYFFAFNWDALGRLQKLGLPQGITVLALVAGHFVGVRRIGGQLLLVAAAITVGVCFAVFGQVYQTGADAFGFFGIWALCILPWVIAGAFAPLWVLWFTLVNLTVWFFWDQVGQFHYVEYSYLCIVLTVINGAGLIARESLQTRYDWLKGHWIRALFLLGALIPLLIPAINLFLEVSSHGTHYAQLMGTVLWLLSLGAAHLYYTRVRFDSTAICIVLGNGAVYLLCGIGRIFDEIDLYEGGAGFLLMALIIGGVTTMVVRLLRWLKQRYGQPEGAQA